MAAKQAVPTMVLVAVIMMASAGVGASAEPCNPANLAVCAPAILNGSPPTAPCCSNLRAQEPCFCEYAHNPAYSSYVNSPNARSTLTSCGIAIPNC